MVDDKHHLFVRHAMSDKAFFSATAIALTFIAFLPYIRSVLQGKTRPHVFSWVIWGFATFVVFLAQLADKGGAGAWPIGVSGVVTLYVAFLAATKKSDITITKTDSVFLIVAITSLPFWYLTTDPLWAVLILTMVDVAGFGPTFRKAYGRPHEEQLLFYLILVVRNLLVLAALEHYSLTTVLFPVVTAIICVLFVVIVAYRRRVLVKNEGTYSSRQALSGVPFLCGLLLHCLCLKVCECCLAKVSVIFPDNPEVGIFF